MGCHLYVKEINTGNDVYIPWISVYLLEHIEIKDKGELETLLKFHQLSDRNNKAKIQYEIDYLIKEQDEEGEEAFHKNVLQMRNRYKMSVIYQSEKDKGRSNVAVLITVLKIELERHIKFSLTDQVRGEILDTFKQGTHIAYTG